MTDTTAASEPRTLCRTCVTPIAYIDAPTGGWWAHDTHPADGHDAVPGAWVGNDELMEAIAAAVWEHCGTEGTSLVVDDPRNIAGTATAVARRFADAEQAELNHLRARIAELEGPAVEARAALAALCYDLEDPGSNALGALFLLSRATVGVEAPKDDAAAALARHDAEVLRRAAETLEATDRDDDAVNLLYLLADQATAECDRCKGSGVDPEHAESEDCGDVVREVPVPCSACQPAVEAPGAAR
ncbi:hypothetical protein [Streptomyces sp. NPDC001492]